LQARAFGFVESERRAGCEGAFEGFDAGLFGEEETAVYAAGTLF
jgi:hypothetical protein